MKLASKGSWSILIILIYTSALMLTALARPDPDSSQITRSIMRNVSPGDAYAILQNGSDLVILDVRTPQEYQVGRLEGAVNLDYYSNGFLDGLKSLDKNLTYIVYCRRGIRGGKAMEMMNSLGFKQVYNILGGLTLWAKEDRLMIGKVL